jgi:hypothetical protein
MVTLIRSVYVFVTCAAACVWALSGLGKAKRPRGDGGRRSWTLEEAFAGDDIRADDRCDDCCSLGEPYASRST